MMLVTGYHSPQWFG